MTSPAIEGKAARCTRGSRREAAVLERFIGVFCRRRHGDASAAETAAMAREARARAAEALCPDCGDLLKYALKRLERCPYDPKPRCKACPTHCYRPEYRQRIKEVMRYSGIYFVKRGRLDWLIRYFLT